MKALSGIEMTEVDSFESFYLSREYQKCLSVGQRKTGSNNNNAWQHFIFIYFYRCKIDVISIFKL